MAFIEIWAQGNLTADAKFSLTQSGKNLNKFSIAVGTGKDKVEYYEVDCWDMTADMTADLKKGEGVLVKGKPTHKEWTDRNGNKRSTPTITASWVFPLSRKNKGEGVAVAAAVREATESSLEEIDLADEEELL
jgi:single-stranded DNA-binding protein